MDPINALVDETIRRIMEDPIEETAVVIEAAPEVVETPEQRDARLQREDYARKNAQAIKDREDILRRNKVLAPDEPFSMDPDAAVNLRCCG